MNKKEANIASKIKHSIFDLVNKERRAAGIKTLKWDDRVAQVAKEYSKTLSIEGFHHKDIEGRDAGDRLKASKIFYIVAAENLYMIGGLNESVDISEAVVNGWMKSPGHRSPIMDRDELFSDAGVGMYCEKKTCYAVMVFTGLERHQNIQLNPGYLTFLYLYDPSYPFDFDVPVYVEIDSTDYINLYFVPDREQYDNLLQNRFYKTISENKQIKRFSSTVVADKGEGIIIQSSGDRSAEINVLFRYS